MDDDLKAVVERVEWDIARAEHVESISASVPLKDLRTLLSAHRKMVEALEPFAAVADEYDAAEDDEWHVSNDAPSVPSIRPALRLANFRRARAALTGSREHG